MKTTEKTEKTTRSDPLEKYFNIPEHSTEVVKTVIKTELTTTDSTLPVKVQELTGIDEYDKKDHEIEETYLEVYDKALTAHDMLVDELAGIEGKYVARIHEVMNQTLGTALKAAENMARMKEHKDKLVEKRKGPSTSKTNVTTNNTVIMNTVDAIKRLREMDTIDVEVLAMEEK